MTYNTGNLTPSLDPRDLDDNAQAFDRFMHSSENTEPDRLGVERLTWHYVEEAAAALTDPNVIGLAALTSAAGKAFRFTGTAGQMATYDLSALGITLAGIANAAAGRAAIGAVSASDNIATANALATSRAISVTGDGTWSVTFNGSADVTAAFTLAASGVAAGTYGSVTVNAKGLVTAASVATPIANGGTGAITAPLARAALGLAPTAWAALTLANSWVVAAGSRASYRSFLDTVSLEVVVSGGTATAGTIVATLPAGFRPAFAISFPVNATPSGSSLIPIVAIATDGTIRIYNAAAGSGIGFLATFATV